MSLKYPAGPTETKHCIESLLAVFQHYAGRDRSTSSLSKRKFLTFMNTELASFTKDQKDPSVLDLTMKKLDMNCDGQLDFSKFLNLIVGLVQACHIQVMSSLTSRATRNPPALSHHHKIANIPENRSLHMTKIRHCNAGGIIYVSINKN
uniref:protein S100-A11-like n=1 Tax=Euleptes europaea TaxID=460621 RepID=UPI002540A07C|nr:protein S100-A11-like [Euleptes europaea]